MQKVITILNKDHNYQYKGNMVSIVCWTEKVHTRAIIYSSNSFIRQFRYSLAFYDTMQQVDSLRHGLLNS